MPHFCRLCGRHRPNEKFSGGEHRIHVCKECQQMPREQRRILEARLEFEGYLGRQSHISAKNLKRLQELQKSDIPLISAMAATVHAAALATPFKRKRWGRLRHQHRQIFEELDRLDLLPPEFLGWAEEEEYCLADELEFEQLIAASNLPSEFRHEEGPLDFLPEDEIPF